MLRIGGTIILVMFLTCAFADRSGKEIEIEGKRFTLMRYQNENTYVLIRGALADGGPFSSYDDLLLHGLLDVPAATTRFRVTGEDKKEVLIEHLKNRQEIYYVDYVRAAKLMDRDHKLGRIQSGCLNYAIGNYRVIDGILQEKVSSILQKILRS